MSLGIDRPVTKAAPADTAAMAGRLETSTLAQHHISVMDKAFKKGLNDYKWIKFFFFFFSETGFFCVIALAILELIDIHLPRPPRVLGLKAWVNMPSSNFFF